MHRPARTASALLAAAGLTAVVSPAFGVSSYFDGVFAPADWSHFTITNGPGAGSTAAASQVLIGGNPNEYRRIDITLVSTDLNGAIFSLNVNNTAFYDPGTQGPISWIDYTEDSINFLANSGNGQGTGLLILQVGSIYVQRNPVLVMPQPAFANWAPNAAPGLVASDLWELTNSGQLLPASNPDFSAAGPLMQLGFWRGASSGNFVGTSLRDAGIDNWNVRIVPGPAALALLAGAGLAASARRRRV